MRPEDVGFTMTDLVLGKHSGRAALADRAKALGYHLTGEQLNAVFEQFKVLADKKKEIYDADTGRSDRAADPCRRARSVSLESYEITCGNGAPPARDGSRSAAAKEIRSHGEGLRRRAGRRGLPGNRGTDRLHVSCKDFRVHSVTVGKDAQGEVTVQVEHENVLYRGRGVSTDSVEASAKAFLNAINRIVAVGNGKKEPANL